ncbi:MAG: AAA family ATPase [Caldilineaceae bacterium]
MRSSNETSQPISNPAQAKRIPYGVADYGRLRRENAYYVDKTHYIPRIEAAPFYLFCIRPRRFGKSLWLSVLQHYYDVNQAENFDFLFGETYIGQNPTPDRNSYLTLFFNFALVNPAIDEVQRSFEKNGHAVVQDFLIRYQRFFAEEERQKILQEQKVEDKLRLLFFHAHRQQSKIYLFIDEYDNFANTILTTHGQKPITS